MGKDRKPSDSYDDEPQLRLLILNDGEKLDTTIYRLKKGWRLRFMCGPSLQGKSVRIFCNHPARADCHQELTYRELPSAATSTATDARGRDAFDKAVEDVDIVLAGSFQYYFTTGSSTSEAEASGSGYFLVDPELGIGVSGYRGSDDSGWLPLDAVALQTVLPKQLGPLDDWLDRLAVARAAGYNVVHFTPVQKLNSHSHSSYSISDQLAIDPRYGAGLTLADVGRLVAKMAAEWGILSVADLVLNHTAVDSAWLLDAPECAYSPFNSPHLRPAYIFDRGLVRACSAFAGRMIKDEADVQDVVRTLIHDMIPELNIHEYFSVDVDTCCSLLSDALRKADPAGVYPPATEKDVVIVQDPQYRRRSCTVDTGIALRVYVDEVRRADDKEKELAITCAVSKFRSRLEILNAWKRDEITAQLVSAIQGCAGGIRYRFFEPHGPRAGVVSTEQPLIDPYFVDLGGNKSTSLEEDELTINDAVKARFVMAHNGWIMNYDPMKNFAEPGSHAYLRRELIIWSDSVKLRFGQSPNDCPYLWQRMTEYTVKTAEVFHGIRLDNCHSTPLHVAEYMLKAARTVRPDIYVIAELFTSNEHTDNIYVNRLGLTSLIREALNGWSPHEQGAIVHRYGGVPVGSFFSPAVQLIRPTVAHALLMDITHDNEALIQKRSVYDVLPTAAFVSMACCASGSTRGYDELVPHHIHVVNEKRLYSSWTTDPKTNNGFVNGSSGILAARQVLNKLHEEMGCQGFDEVYVHDLSGDTVSITRHHPIHHQSIICVTRTAFTQPSVEKLMEPATHVQPLTFEGVIQEVVLFAYMQSETSEGETRPGKYTADTSYINGLPGFSVVLKCSVGIDDIKEYVTWQEDSQRQQQTIKFLRFPPGSVLFLRVKPYPGVKAALEKIYATVDSMHCALRPSSDGRQALPAAVSQLTLTELNHVLYRCNEEELAQTRGSRGVYDVPRYGRLVYAGLQGVLSLLARMRTTNDLGHALCDNLRAGLWLVDYTVERLGGASDSATKFAAWLKQALAPLADLPKYLVPCYLDVILVGVQMLLYEAVWTSMPDPVSGGLPFVRALALSTLQFCGHLASASLPPLASSVLDPSAEGGVITVAAGLPHFSEGIMRNWGRDTFIALRGLLLLTGRHEDARRIILAFGGCLCRGLIPNLLGEGKHARYNCRDAVWWWLKSVQDYCSEVKDSSKKYAILGDTVLRLYPAGRDNSEVVHPLTEQKLEDTIQEAMQCHADGIAFREHNAGPQLDRDMQDEGFNVSAGVNWSTGFVFGGSKHNCGTWMDKMGSSEKAGNKGVPASARNGSAVELVALCASTVRWLAELHNSGHFKHSGVHYTNTQGTVVDITYADWYRLIQKNFEKYFWIGIGPADKEVTKPELIHRRNIYKDCVGADPAWADYQLRPNFPVAMVVAPDLFTPANAQAALTVVKDNLVGPLGMKTLDPSDWSYRGDYVNSNDSDDFKIARGFNYHNGPEWVWPFGYFVRALLYFADAKQPDKSRATAAAAHYALDALSSHRHHLDSTDWRSLPELTNSNGKFCPDGCPAQAWSVACILEAMHDLQETLKGLRGVK